MFIDEHRNEYPVSTLCRLLQVCRSGFYAWKSRMESRRVREDRALLDHIERIHRASREAYGTVKTWKALNKRGISCGRNRVSGVPRVGPR